jgi:hypothetical protein
MSESNENIDQEKDVYWGTSLWIFFHVLANKIKSDSFHIIRSELLEIIVNICKNIDCNMCRSHSIEYLEKNNFMQISSINELKLFFFNFHNSVNFQKNKELFLFDDLDSKYNGFNIFNVLKNILKHDYVFNENIEIEFINGINNWFYNKMHNFNN